jgi:spondin N/flagellar hook capping protein FlgD
VNRPIAYAALMAVLFVACMASAQTARYQATFDATWTAETHPDNYPPNPHFSGLVGGTHNSGVSFWAPGALASLGMERMAEWGSQNDLLAEVQTAIDAGLAEFTIADAPLWTVPGSTSVEFDMSPAFPLVTLVAMLAPSPDWFIGVRDLDLRPGGQWAQEIVVDLYCWDSGTDSGPDYTSANQNTVPAEPIFAITGAPFSPGVPLGTLTFTRVLLSDVPRAGDFTATAYPNPFNPRTTIAWNLPQSSRMSLEILDIKGRRIKALWNDEMAAGPGQMEWDGRNEAGRPVTSGQYFYRLRAGNETHSGGLTLLK